jgi:nucleoside-diphosphate-sugar epimerase
VETERLKILLIGGSGFVSGTLAQVALAQGHRVWVLTRGLRPLRPDVVHLVADRHDSPVFAGAVDLAATHWDLAVDCIAYHPDDIRQDLATLSGRVGHFVFISTDFVFDPVHRKFPQPEEADFYLADGYGGLKRQCEQVLLSPPAPEMNWTVIRPCHIYGPGSELGCLPAHGRDPQLIRKLQTGTPLQLVGGGYFLQQPVFARDLAAIILNLAGKPATYSQIYNIAGPDVVESREYYRLIAACLGVTLRIAEVPVDEFRQAHPEAASFLCHRIYDLYKLRRSGVTVPATPLAAGLREHVFHKLQNLAEKD